MNPTLSPISSAGYGLTLSDGCSWWLSGINDSALWLERFAAIMELRQNRFNGSPKLVFSVKGTPNLVEGRASTCVTAKLSHGGSNTGWTISHPDASRLWCAESVPDVLCELSNKETDEIQIVNMWYALLPIYQRSICKGGLPFHAGLAELDGQGILIAAPGDSGKSTCCRRLPEYWRPLCDDEALVVLNKEKKYRAHSFPTWSDYLWKQSKRTWNVQYSVPLSAVFFLEQSRTDEVVRVGEGEAVVLMTESATQVCKKFWRGADKEYQNKFRRDLFDNACKMAKNIPAYRLRVSLDGKFWENMEQVLG